MGAHKKPMELRKLQGTSERNKQRQNKDAPPVVRGIGPAPKYFTEAESEVWDYFVSIMFVGVLSETDRPSLEIMSKLLYRFRHGEHDKEAVIVQLNGAELSRLDSLIARYGMTPSDRQKIVQPKTEDSNPFGDM
jgi:hypothetical protein